MSLTAVQRASLKKKNANQRKKRVPEQTIEPEKKDSDMTVEEFLEMLQGVYKENVENVKQSKDEDYIKIALIEMEQIWLNIQMLMQSKKYDTMTDGQKIDLIQKDFPDFYKNFPVVSRYAICMGQYSSAAFKKMLIRSKEETKKDTNEKIWIERQADYIRYLWEELHGNKFVQKDSDAIWKQAFDSLTKEFNDFREMHEIAEKQVKIDEAKYKKELLYELSDRVIEGTQSLPIYKTKELIDKLNDKLFRQRFKKMIKQLASTCQMIEPVSIGLSCNEYARQEYEEELKNSFYKKTYKKIDINKIAV